MNPYACDGAGLARASTTMPIATIALAYVTGGTCVIDELDRVPAGKVAVTKKELRDDGARRVVARPEGNGTFSVRATLCS